MTPISRLLPARALVMAAVFAASIGAAPAMGFDVGEKVQINGFGGWAAGDTDVNQYLGGDEERDYDSISFSLLVSADVSDQLTIRGQVHNESIGEELDTALDFAFAEWRFSDLVRLRGGFVKQPFGIYTEIFDVGTVRPFFDLPQGIYGPSEFVAEAYQGLGLTGYKRMESGWALGYDVYGGELTLPSTEAFNDVLFGDEEGEELESDEKLKDVLGGRLKFYVPGGKVHFGLSAYTGVPEEEPGEAGEFFGATARQDVYGAHAEYAGSKWSVRMEYAHREGGDEKVEVGAAYFEIARYFGEHWQVGARYDWAERDPREVVDVDESALEHEDRALTVNYWLSSNMVFKLSYHFVEGLLYARPADPTEAESETNLLQLGLQFSF